MTAYEVVELTPAQVRAHDDQRALTPGGHEALAEAYRRVFAGADRLLDAGGGSGVAVPALSTAAPVVVVADWSLSMLAAAEGRAPLRCAADLTRLPFADRSFDGVHAAYAIQNVTAWQRAVAECVRVCSSDGPVVVAWGGEPADERLAALMSAYFSGLGDAVGVRAQRSGITLDAATELFASLGKPLTTTVSVEDVQRRTPRQVVERTALNPYRAQPDEQARTAAVASALRWAESSVGPVDEPLDLTVVRRLHVYGGSPPA